MFPFFRLVFLVIKHFNNYEDSHPHESFGYSDSVKSNWKKNVFYMTSVNRRTTEETKLTKKDDLCNVFNTWNRLLKFLFCFYLWSMFFSFVLHITTKFVCIFAEHCCYSVALPCSYSTSKYNTVELSLIMLIEISAVADSTFFVVVKRAVSRKQHMSSILVLLPLIFSLFTLSSR